MGLIRSAVRAAATLGSTDLSTPEQWIVDWFTGGAKSASGIEITPTNAMTWGPYFAGVRNLSEDVGSLPFPTYERLDRGKRRAPEHPVYGLLHDAPNDMMGAMQFRSTLTGHAMTWGGGAAYVVANNAGRVLELWPLRPDRLEVEVVKDRVGRVGRRWTYRDNVNGIHAALHDDQVLHIPNFGFDGVRGYSTLSLMREAIGLGLATEKFGASFFGNGSKPGGVLTHPKAVSDGARRRIKADWESLHKGLDRQQRIAILEEGVEFEGIGIPPGDSQFLETRQFQVRDAARWLRIPAHKLGDLDDATYSNIEHQSLEYVVDSLRPWLVRWEQAVAMRLFTPSERSQYFSEHLVEGLLRGDIQTRYEAYSIGRQWGWESPNSVLEKENRNPIPGGDTYMVPLNMMPLEALDGASDPERTARIGLRAVEGRRRIGEAFAPMVEDVDRSLAKIERQEIGALANQHLRSTSAFLADVEDLYEDKLRGRYIDRWTPLFTTFAAEVAASAAADVGHDDDVDLSRFVERYVQSHVGYRVGSSLGQLGAVMDGADDPAEAVEARLDKWVADRPAKTARWESVQLRNAAARETWKEAGIRRMRWVSSGGDCPACESLDGRVVGIDEPFVEAGATVGGDDQELEVARKMLHPPLHPGCDCSIVAE